MGKTSKHPVWRINAWGKRVRLTPAQYKQWASEPGLGGVRPPTPRKKKRLDWSKPRRGPPGDAIFIDARPEWDAQDKAEADAKASKPASA